MLQYLRSNWSAVARTVRSATIIFWLVLTGGIIVFLLTTTLAAHQKNMRLKEHFIKLNYETQFLDYQNKHLRREITAIQEDPFYLEMVMRQELNMLQEGEIVIKPHHLQAQ